MAQRMSTATRMDRARDNAAVTRAENGARKRKEKATRTARMHALVKKGTFPYTPAIQSWLSATIGKPFTQIKEEDVKALVK